MKIEELDKIINFIYKKFETINNNWELNTDYKKINMKKKKVVDLVTDSDLSDAVFNYRNYVFNFYNDLFQ